MPAIQFDQILSFSTEDSVFQAKNLIESDSKWVGACDNDSRQYVTIKLKEQCHIRQIEIENESSAFIEVQAGNETDHEDDYSVILAAKSFMSPSESKNKLHTNRMKIFIDDLDERYLDKKFNVIKVICTQPFNSSMQFGVKSVKVFDEATIDENKKDAAKINTGVFELKKNLPVSSLAGISLGGYKPKPVEETSAQIGSTFQAWRGVKEETKSMKDKEEAKANVETESVFEKWKRSEEVKRKDEEKIAVEKENVKNEPLEETNKVSVEVKKEAEVKPKPRFNERSQILKGVVFALSGYVNPLRSEIRDKGLKMGAKYRPDWTDECTHLICAFSNTPKAAQVREAGGRVVSPEWFDECKTADKLIDCDEFIIKEESEPSDSDSEAPRKAAKQAKNKLSKLKKAKDEYDDSYDESEAENSDDKDFIVNTSDEEDVVSSSSASSTTTSMDSEDSERVVRKKKSKKAKKVRKHKKKDTSDDSSGSDSETETKKRKKNSSKKSKLDDKENVGSSSKKLKKEIKYEGDEESRDSSKVLTKKESNSSSKTEANSDLDGASWELPDFFEGKSFYIYGDYEKKTKNMISRYIIGFGGDIEDYMGSNVDFVITNKSWNDDFKKSKKEHKNLVIVNDEWINACARRKKWIAYQTFEIDSN